MQMLGALSPRPITLFFGGYDQMGLACLAMGFGLLIGSTYNVIPDLLWRCIALSSRLDEARAATAH